MTSMLLSRARRLALAASTTLLALGSACSGDGPTNALDRLAPAQLALQATVRFQTTGNAVLRVRPSYLRTDRTRPALEPQNISLTDAAAQQVPITINLAPCLADPLRGTATGGAPAADECVVWVELALLTNGEVVDQDTLRNISLRPGQTSTATGSITLDEVGTVRLVPPTANVVSAGAPLRLEATRTMTVGVEVRDGANRPLVRNATWSSANTTIATVTNAGLVTGVAPGTVRLTAIVGATAATVDVRVVPLPQTVTITAGAGTSGTGTVVSSPAGLTCALNGTTTSGTCTASFPGDATVSLSMVTGTSTTFVGWGGDCTGTSACSFATSQPRTVSATLRAVRTLTVSGVGPGNGSITAPNGVINCTWQNGSTSGGPCTAQLPDGAQITLTATAATNNRFAGWRGDCATSTGPTCQLTMTADRAAIADFGQLAVYRITAGSSTGNGTVLSSPAGMNCTVTGTAVSGVCTLAVVPGTIVSLSAEGTGGSTFRQWGGTCADATSVCVRINSTGGDFNSTVGFDNSVSFTLTPEANSTGSAQITGPNFFCSVSGSAVTSAPCVGNYPVGTTLTVEAFPTGFTEFVGWGGACANFTGPRCTVTLTSNTAASIRFLALPTVQLRVGLTGNVGRLRITQDRVASRQECSRTVRSADSTFCTLRAVPGRPMTLAIITTLPVLGYFDFGGLCSSVENSECSATITSNNEVYVYFYNPDEQSAPPMGLKSSAPGGPVAIPKRKGSTRQ